MNYEYNNGQFKPAELRFEGDEQDVDKAWFNAGYIPAQRVGNTHGLHYVLLEHNERQEWLVMFSTAFSYTVIKCTEWLDLITLLERLSPIVLAGALESEDSGMASFLVRAKEGEW